MYICISITEILTFLYTVSLGQSHKYLILHRIMACYYYLYKLTAALYKDTQKQNKLAIATWSIRKIALTTQPS